MVDTLAPPVLALRSASKSFGDLQVLRDVTLELHSGEVVAIVGPSGSGKSTMIRCMNLLETPTTGDLCLDGQRVWAPDRIPTRRELRRLRTRVGMVFQAFNLFPTLHALDNVVFPQVHTLGRSKEEAETRARSLLEHVGLAAHMRHYPAHLSGGQQQRVAIARALALDPKVMLFDEPTSAIDPEMRGEVLRTMRDLVAEGMTMAVVTHEIAFARIVADRAIFLSDGEIVESGTAKTVLTDPVNERTKRFLSALFGDLD